MRPVDLQQIDAATFDEWFVHNLSRVAIQIDVKADLPDFDGIEFNYLAEKAQRLFDFGVERVLWVLSKTRRVFVAVPNQDWIFTDWSNDISVMDGYVLNVKRLLDEEEIVY